jgi:hypothetical protein
VVVSKEGYDDYSQSVTIEGGKTKSMDARLSPPTGEVVITTTPPGLEVLIDDKSIGPSPAHAVVAAGPHKYTVNRPGEAPYENSFTAKSGMLVNVRVNMGGGAVPTGIVEVRTIPAGATVMADGNAVGGQTPTSFSLSLGRHILSISLYGYRPQKVEVDVKATGTPPVQITLQR